MREGPEVRRIGDWMSTAVGRMITAANVVSGRYMRPEISDLSRLVGAELERVIVKGKLIIFAFRNGDGVFGALSTLGATGRWYREDLKNPVPDDDKKFTRIVLELDDGSHLLFTDQQNFGTFKVASWNMVRVKQAELGPDIMTPPNLWSIAVPEFKSRINRFGKNQTLAEGLLDQRIVSGCGNYIRDDAMHQAAMSPHRPIVGWTDDELKRLWQAMNNIALSVYRNRMHSWRCYGQLASPTGGKIETFIDKQGHPIWWCPTEQT